MKYCFIFFLIISPLLAFASHDRNNFLIEKKEFRKGGSFRVLTSIPKENIKKQALLIMFVGGQGILSLNKDGKIKKHKNNLIFRMNRKLNELGYITIIPDVPKDLRENKFRKTKLFKQDMIELIKEIQQHWRLPLHIIGKSLGSVSAVNLALGESQGLKSIVLLSPTSKITTEFHEIISPSDWRELKIPTLILHNPYDKCLSSPFSGALEIFNLLNVEKKILLSISSQKSDVKDSCYSRSEHGFWRSEKIVIHELHKWFKEFMN